MAMGTMAFPKISVPVCLRCAHKGDSSAPEYTNSLHTINDQQSVQGSEFCCDFPSADQVCELSLFAWGSVCSIEPGEE